MIKPAILKQQVLLEDIDEAGLESIAKIIKKLSFKKGEYLFKRKRRNKRALSHTCREGGNFKGNP